MIDLTDTTDRRHNNYETTTQLLMEPYRLTLSPIDCTQLRPTSRQRTNLRPFVVNLWRIHVSPTCKPKTKGKTKARKDAHQLQSLKMLFLDC